MCRLDQELAFLAIHDAVIQIYCTVKPNDNDSNDYGRNRKRKLLV